MVYNFGFQEIYKKGGRKFGFVNLPPWGCTPSLKVFQQGNKGVYIDEVTVLVKLQNRALPKVVKKQQRQLRGFNYSVFEPYTSISERIENPSKNIMFYLATTCYKVSLSLLLFMSCDFLCWF